MDLSAIRQAAREAFEDKLAKTRLNYWPMRGGVTITGWGNQGRDIEAELQKAELPYERNLSGTFIVSSWPMEQNALKAALPECRKAPCPCPCPA